MGKISYLILVIVILSYSRINNKIGKDENQIKVINLSSTEVPKITNLSDIANDVEYIPLQTTSNSLITRVYRIKTYGDTIIIDNLNRSSRELIFFDNSGHYLFKLDKSGRGPGEYRYINDFDFNSKQELIINSGRDIFVYTLKGTKFTFKEALKIIPFDSTSNPQVSFFHDQNRILLSYPNRGTEKFRNLLINFQGDTLSARPNYYKFAPKEENKFLLSAGSTNYSYNNLLYFKEPASDTVFTCTQSNRIIPYLILNSNGKSLTPQAQVQIIKNGIKTDYSPPYIIITSIMEVPRYLFYKYEYMKTMVFGVYDKVLNKKFGINAKTFLMDDITGGANFEPRFCSEGKLFSCIEAIELKKLTAGESFKNSKVKDPAKKEVLKRLATSLNELDNPVLIIVKPK